MWEIFVAAFTKKEQAVAVAKLQISYPHLPRLACLQTFLLPKPVTEMHSTLASFLAGALLALAFTHDVSSGNEILARRLAFPGAHTRDPFSSATATPSLDAALPGRSPRGGDAGGGGGGGGGERRAEGDDAVVATAGDAGVNRGDAIHDEATARRAEGTEKEYSHPPSHKQRFADGLSAREATAAAMAATKLAVALWARAARPVTDSVRLYASAGYHELVSHLWRFLTTTDPLVLAAAAAAAVALVCACAAALAIARHLRRARYIARLRATAARLRERVRATWRMLTGPFVRALQRVKRFAESVTSRYNALLAGVNAKSRRAAALAPHIILAGVGGVVTLFLPQQVRLSLNPKP